MEKININSLILDYSLYPRTKIDDQHVSYMLEVLKTNMELPPIVVDKKSLRIIDGFHRYTARRRFHKLNKDNDSLIFIDAIMKSYKSEAEMFADAMRLNSSHGRMLTQYDRAHCIIKAEELGLTVNVTTEALSITCNKYDELKVGHIGKLHISPHLAAESIPLKRTIRYKAGKKLTTKQVEVNKMLSGMNQSFYVNQIIMLIESDLLDVNNKNLMERLEKLSGLLEKVLFKKIA